MCLPSVGECALRTIFLDVHSKEADVHTINLLKGKKCFGSVGKRLGHFSSVHKPDVTEIYGYEFSSYVNMQPFNYITTKS